jgi:2-keto-3-deoxy-L-fuconate dehydrogenase
VEKGSFSLSADTPNSQIFRLDRKIAVVTGGAKGIGRAIAELFAARGASVHILDVQKDLADETAREIAAAGGRATAHECNVADSAAVQRVFREIAKLGRIHILVNNAGIAQIGKLETTTEADFDAVFSVNVKGVYNCMYACIEHMKENAGGVILNMASIAATSGLADRFGYSASKGAVVAMTLSVARDYLAHNIRCNCISPARIHTPFVDGFLQKNYPGRELEMMQVLSKAQPVGRMGKSTEVASLALYLCCDESSFVTGADYPLDGGFFNLR